MPCKPIHATPLTPPTSNLPSWSSGIAKDRSKIMFPVPFPAKRPAGGSAEIAPDTCRSLMAKVNQAYEKLLKMTITPTLPLDWGLHMFSLTTRSDIGGDPTWVSCD